MRNPKCAPARNCNFTFPISAFSFSSKLGGALQETDETQLWLELLREECGISNTDTLPIEQEANELMAIMTTMIQRTR